MRKLFIILFILFAATAVFADTDRYIITTCSTNGDGTLNSCTAGGAGTAGAYTTCANAESDIQSDCANNLTTCGGGIFHVHASGSTADGQCIFAGVTYDSTHYFSLEGDNTTGKWDATKYHLTASNNGTGTIDFQDQFVHLKNLAVETTGSGSGTYGAIMSQNTDGINFTIQNVIARAGTCNSGGGGSCRPLVEILAGTANDTTIVANSVFYGTDTNNEPIRLQNPGTSRKIILYNNTLRTGGNCLVMYDGGSSDSLYMKNNVLDNCTTDNAFFVGGNWSTLSTANNITHDNTSPDTSGCNGGTCRSKTCSYVNTTFSTMDLHLSSSDATCRDTATDLSADGQFSFSTDIDGDTRPVNSTWDIGADEAPAVSSGSGVPVMIGGGIL